MNGFEVVAQGSANKTSGPVTSLGRAIEKNLRRQRDVVLTTSQGNSGLALTVQSTRAAVQARRADARCFVIVPEQDGGSSIAVRTESALSEFGDIRPTRSDRAVESRRTLPLDAKNRWVIVATAPQLIDLIRLNTVDASLATICIVDAVDSPTPPRFSADVQFVYTKLDPEVTTVLIEDSGTELPELLDLLRRPAIINADRGRPLSPNRLNPVPIEEPRMKNLPVDPAELQRTVKSIVQHIHDEEDPVQMTRYKRLFKKYTSVFNRGYVAAYLLKQLVEDGRTPLAAREKKPKSKANNDTEQQSIFVSIGRNRRVHTRDLITFFTSADGITRDDIGQIKVLDNYSFVEVSSDKAQAAIDALNNKELRGRKLTVNFARRK